MERGADIKLIIKRKGTIEKSNKKLSQIKALLKFDCNLGQLLWFGKVS